MNTRRDSRNLEPTLPPSSVIVEVLIQGCLTVVEGGSVLMVTGSAEGRTGESREKSFGLTTVVVVVPVEVILEAAAALAALAAGVTTMVCVMGFGFFKRLCGCFG